MHIGVAFENDANDLGHSNGVGDDFRNVSGTEITVFGGADFVRITNALFPVGDGKLQQDAIGGFPNQEGFDANLAVGVDESESTNAGNRPELLVEDFVFGGAEGGRGVNLRNAFRGWFPFPWGGYFATMMP